MRFRNRCRLSIMAGSITVAAAAFFAIQGAGAPRASNEAAGVGLVKASQVAALDPETARLAASLNASGWGAAALGKRLPDAARRLTATIDGKHLFLVPTTKGKVCQMLGGAGESCFEPLSRTHPVQLVGDDLSGPGGHAPVFYGVAVDGVRAVTFKTGAQSHTVEVTDNVFVFHGDLTTPVDSLNSTSATFDDGTVVALP